MSFNAAVAARALLDAGLPWVPELEEQVLYEGLIWHSASTLGWGDDSVVLSRIEPVAGTEEVIRRTQIVPALRLDALLPPLGSVEFHGRMVALLRKRLGDTTIHIACDQFGWFPARRELPWRGFSESRHSTEAGALAAAVSKTLETR